MTLWRWSANAGLNICADEGFKQAADKEFSAMIGSLRALTDEQREVLYSGLGDHELAVRSLVAQFSNSP